MTIIGLRALDYKGLLSVPHYTLLPPLNFLRPSIAFAFHSILSLSALDGMNITMYAAIKRCVPFANLFMAVLVLKKPPPSPGILLSILMITLGCIIASAGDLQFELRAYIWGIASVLAQAVYLTFVQKYSEKEKLTAVAMIYINAVNTLPVFLLSTLFLGEPGQIYDRQAEFLQFGFLSIYGILVLAGSVLMYSQFLCTSVCSALTTSLVGVAKSVLTLPIGFVTFGGVPFSVVNITGLIINLIGGILYSRIKYDQDRARRKDGFIVATTDHRTEKNPKKQSLPKLHDYSSII